MHVCDDSPDIKISEEEHQRIKSNGGFLATGQYNYQFISNDTFFKKFKTKYYLHPQQRRWCFQWSMWILSQVSSLIMAITQSPSEWRQLKYACMQVTECFFKKVIGRGEQHALDWANEGWDNSNSGIEVMSWHIYTRVGPEIQWMLGKSFCVTPPN